MQVEDRKPTIRQYLQTSAVYPAVSDRAVHLFLSRRLADCSVPLSSTVHLLGFDLREQLCFLKELEADGQPQLEDQAAAEAQEGAGVAAGAEAHTNHLMGVEGVEVGLGVQRKNELVGEADTSYLAEEGALRHRV